MIRFTEFLSSNPCRAGWYSVAGSLRSYWDGAQWSATVDEDASEAAHERAQLEPLPQDQRRGMRWRGLTENSFAWLAYEMNQRAA